MFAEKWNDVMLIPAKCWVCQNCIFQGFVLGHFPAAQWRFARVCPSALVDTLAPSPEFVTNSNRKCGQPGIFVFKITDGRYRL